ncbi:MAG: hypothetical protein KC636_31425, partial [Myxococcales bacterium]|nr:hypothetical protein [Myxococcales bacterium]
LDDAPELAGARAHVAATLERLAALVDQPLGGASLIRAAQHRSPDAIHVTVRGEGAATLAAAVRRARLELPGPITLTRGPDVGETSAIVCRGQVCTAPLLEVTELARALSRRP